jgi:hypothetical protein
MTNNSALKSEPGRHSGLVRVAAVYFTAAAVLIGCFVAAFIFTCGMKSMDGPGGAQNEAMPMMALFAIVPLMLTGFTWSALRRKVREYYHGPTYAFPAGAIGYFIVAAVAGFAMGEVQWGPDFIHLASVSIGALGAAAAVALGCGLHLLARDRKSSNG